MAFPSRAPNKRRGRLERKPVSHHRRMHEWLKFQRIYKALGYDFKHVEIDPKSQADALQAGTIAGAVAYTTAGRSLASYWKETEIRTDVKMINPCPDEVAKLKAAGLAIADVNPKNAFSKDVGVTAIQGVPILFAYQASAPTCRGRGLQDAEASTTIARTLPPPIPLHAHGQGFRRHAVNASPPTPHSGPHGLAKFLKEHKAWNDKWKISLPAPS